MAGNNNQTLEFTQVISVNIGHEFHGEIFSFLGKALTGSEVTHAKDAPIEVLERLNRLSQPVRLRATFSLNGKGELSILNTEPA